MNDKPLAGSSKERPQGPVWTPTLEVERMMRNVQANEDETMVVNRKVFEGLLYDSLVWRQERAAQKPPAHETPQTASNGSNAATELQRVYKLVNHWYGETQRLTSAVSSLQNECERLMTELDQRRPGNETPSTPSKDAEETGCAHCLEVYEIWAGSEGITPETAPEAYLSRVMVQMRAAAAVGMLRPAQETCEQPRNWAIWRCYRHERLFAAHAGCSMCAADPDPSGRPALKASVHHWTDPKSGEVLSGTLEDKQAAEKAAAVIEDVATRSAALMPARDSFDGDGPVLEINLPGKNAEVERTNQGDSGCIMTGDTL